MIRYLGDTLCDFPGSANQTRCFVHTINLVAKSILKPFDVRKGKDIRALDDALADLAEGLSDGDEEEDKGDGEDDEDDEGGNEDNAGLEPIRLTLLKVCLRLIGLNVSTLS
jgi:hypothetical protein